MRGLNAIEIELVNGGDGGISDYQWPDRSEIERQVQELRDFLEEQQRRNGRQA